MSIHASTKTNLKSNSLRSAPFSSQGVGASLSWFSLWDLGPKFDLPPHRQIQGPNNIYVTGRRNSRHGAVTPQGRGKKQDNPPGPVTAP